MERIEFLVGPNGCGKTQELLRVQEGYSYPGRVATITNTPFDRFPRSTRAKPVLRISPYGVRKATDDNLVNFFDAVGRDTFDISDLLVEIGFYPEVELVAEIDPERLPAVSNMRTNRFDRETLEFVLNNLHSNFIINVGLSSSENSLERSFRGQNRVFFKNIKPLARQGILKKYELIFRHEGRGSQRFSELSSGEQTLISTFLFVRSNLENLQVLLVDEPENSLHPKWQRKYLEFLHMAIGYSETRLILATHSPVIVSGGISSYKNDVGVFSLIGGKQERIQVASEDGEESVEEILFEAFDTVTPVSSFLSEMISEMTWDVQEGRLKKEEAISKLKDIRNKSYSMNQVNFILACEKVIQNLK